MTESNESNKHENKRRSSGSALNCFVSWSRRLKCRWMFWRLDAGHQKLFRVMVIDPDSKIKRGER